MEPSREPEPDPGNKNTMSEKKNTKKPKSKNPSTPTALSTGANGPMDVELLEQIVKLMSANDLNTVDLRDGEKRVVLKRGAVAAQQFVSHAPAMHSQHAPMPHAPSTPPPPAPVVDEDAGLIPIKSPMVGTFYAKPNKESKPFVTLGSKVNEETDVCLVEAMKVFNNIKAETRGTIAKILIEDGQSVEFNTVMFLVKP